MEDFDKELSSLCTKYLHNASPEACVNMHNSLAAQTAIVGELVNYHQQIQEARQSAQIEFTAEDFYRAESRFG